MGTPWLGWFMGLITACGIIGLDRGNWEWLNWSTILGWITIILSVWATKYLHDKHEEEVGKAYDKGYKNAVKSIQG
jgi:hypothetical protein